MKLPKGKNIGGIFAHPDDEAFEVVGTKSKVSNFLVDISEVI